MQVSVLDPDHTLTISALFNEEIDTVWDYLKDIHNYRNFEMNTNYKLIFLEGNCSFKKPAFFCILKDNKRYTNIKVLDIYSSPSQKKIILEIQLLRIKSEVFLKYELSIELFGTTIKPSTCILLKISKIEISKKKSNNLISYIEKEKQMYSNFLENMAKILKQINSLSYSQIESIVLDANIDDVWEIVNDWVRFSKLLPNFFESLEIVFQSEFGGLGKWALKSLENGKMCFMKIKKRSEGEIERNGKYAVSYLCYENTPFDPIEIISFELLKIDDALTYFLMKNNYSCDMILNQISNITKDKKTVLSQLNLVLNKKKYN